MSFLVLMLTVFSVVQGDALRMVYPHEQGLDGIELQWRNRTVPFVRSGEVWVTVVGADLDLEEVRMTGCRQLRAPSEPRAHVGLLLGARMATGAS